MSEKNYKIKNNLFETSISFKNGDIKATTAISFEFNTSSFAGMFIHSKFTKVWEVKGHDDYAKLYFKQKRTDDIEQDAKTIDYYIENKLPYL